MIKSVKPMFLRRRSSVKNGQRTDTLVWLVESDDKNDGPAVAILAPGIPRTGDQLLGDPYTRVTSIDAQPHENSAYHTIIEVEFSSNQSEAQAVHPLDRPPEYSQGGDESTESYFLDESTPPKPYVNSAGDTFETLGERDGGEITLQVVANLPYWDTFLSDQYRRTTNSDVVTIDNVSYDIGVCKMGVISSVKTQETWQTEVVEYYRVTFPIKVAKDGWHDRPLDYGFNTIKTITKKINNVDTLVNIKLPITDSTGLKIQKQWPLNGHGVAKPSATDTPEKLEFIPYKPVAWGSIGLR